MKSTCAFVLLLFSYALKPAAHVAAQRPAARPDPAPTTRAAGKAHRKAKGTVHGKDLEFLGAFDAPTGGTYRDPVQTRYDYSRGTIGYRDDLDALYLVTHDQDSASVGLIEAPRNLTVAAIPVAKEIEKPFRLRAIPNKSVRLRGLYWDEPARTLYYNFTMWYNVAGADAAGLGALRKGKFFGLWLAAHNNQCGGYITRDDNSGRLIIGSAIGSGLASSSLGPSAFRLMLDEHNLPPANTRVPFQTLLFHPYSQKDNRKYAVLSSDGPWRHGMELSGGVCVGRTLIFALDEGEREFYGQPAQFEEQFGFVPRSSGKGYHNDRHTPMLWFYSLGELESAARRGAPSWSVRPYEYWTIPEIPLRARVGGMTYDRTTRRLFISQKVANPSKTPRVFVYRIRS